MKSILGVALFLCGVALVLSEEKPTSLSDARAAIEANLRTAEGKAFDEQFGKELVQKYLDSMRHCKEIAGASTDSFWILVKLDKDGSVKEVLLSQATNVANCDRDILLKAKFSSAPSNAYWVGIYLKMTH